MMKTYIKPQLLLFCLSPEDILTLSVSASGDARNIDSYSFGDVTFDG